MTLILILLGFCTIYLIELLGNLREVKPNNSDNSNNFKAGCYIKNDEGFWTKYEVEPWN